MELSINMAAALPSEERDRFCEVVEIFNQNNSKNRLKSRYYEGNITLGEVNLGLALPRNFRGLEVGCSWGGKTVDVLAGRSMFDGFVGEDGRDAESMTRIMKANRMRAGYNKACRDELIYGCTFATLSADDALGCKIRWHTPQTAAARWNGEKDRIDCGLAIIANQKTSSFPLGIPGVINFYTDESIWVLRRTAHDRWTAEEMPHEMGRPLMEPLIWNATSDKPFGRSRLKEPIRRLIQGYVRTIANATIGLEFATSPQKYLLGVTDAQYDALIDQKFKTYIGSILTSTTNPDTGENPTFGQLAQGTIQPHVDMLRMLSTQFSAASSLTVTDVGVVNDANPTSSDAILAQSQTLTGLAEQLNTDNGDALYTISQMAQAIARNVTLEELTDEEKNITAHFKNPARPNIAVTADAATKIAAARPGFSDTDIFLEMQGFDQADIRRIKAQEQRARGIKLLTEEFGDENLNEGLG